MNPFYLHSYSPNQKHLKLIYNKSDDFTIMIDETIITNNPSPAISKMWSALLNIQNCQRYICEVVW